MHDLQVPFSKRRSSLSIALGVGSWLVMMALSAPTQAASQVLRYFGEASSKDGRLVYRESHEVELEDDVAVRAVTRYFDPTGHLIAELKSDFRRDPFAPDYEFTDAAGKVMESAKFEKGRFILTSGAKRDAVSAVERAPRLVLGQGLHYFARANIDLLQKGEKLRVRFAIPSRLDAYDFKIRSREAEKPNVVKLQISIDDWFLSLLAPSIEVEYEKGTRRLLTYRGVSNIEGPGGEKQDVFIRYTYPAEASAS